MKIKIGEFMKIKIGGAGWSQVSYKLRESFLK
jgi:hypothetical protein